MSGRLNIMTGLGLMALAAGAMIAGTAFAGDPSRPFAPTSEKFYLNFDMLAPADLNCDADGPGVRDKQSRDLAGKPVLRVTGNAKGAQITCSRPDGSRYTTDANRRQFYNTAEPLRATVTYERNDDTMTVVLRRGDDLDDIVEIAQDSFLRVTPGAGTRAGTGAVDSGLAALGGFDDVGADTAPALAGD